MEPTAVYWHIKKNIEVIFEVLVLILAARPIHCFCFLQVLRLGLDALMINCATDRAFRKRTLLKVKKTSLKINLTLKDLPGACRYVFNTVITVAFCCDVDVLHVCTVVHFRYMLRSCPHPRLLRRNFKTALFTPNTKCFLFTLRREQSPMILIFCVRKARAGKSHDFRDLIIFEKILFKMCFPLTPKRKASVFKFLRFEERLRQA